MNNKHFQTSMGLDKDDQGLHRINKSTHLMLTYLIFVSLKITTSRFHLIQPHKNSHQAISYTDLSQSPQQRGASCTAISECTLSLLCYANADIMCALYWSQ